MNNLSCMWSRCGSFWMIGVLFSISMQVTAHGTSWAATTPKIAAGGAHTLALKSDGTVWTWGINIHGESGDGTTTQRTTPVQVTGLNDVTAIAGGYYHTVALKSDGTVWAWGKNDYGQLGDGTYTNKTTPVQLSSLSDVTAIAGGYYHTVVLKSDGTVWAWGWNLAGQLGDGTTMDRTTPVKVYGLSGVTAIAGGYLHSVALKSVGTVWAWGHNNEGELGDGTSYERHSPVQVSGMSGVTAIAGGNDVAFALKSDGTVWAWGRNYYGQLGDGTYTNKTTPVQLSSLSGVTAIACGYYHTVALKSDGTVWAWGKNDYGQLGDGTTSNKNSTPVQVSGLSDVTAIAAGEAHTLALKSDGTVWAWGHNSYYSLGDGTHMDRTTPVQVSGLNLYTSAATTPTLTPTPTPTPTPIPTSTTPDTTAPICYVNIDSDSSYTNSTDVTLRLSATDNVGVTGYYISYSSSTPSASAPGWTSVTSTTSYGRIVSYSLSGGEGAKTVYVWFKDAAGNVSNSESHTFILDTTAPTVNITSPTTDTTYTTMSSTMSLGGSASDSTSGISSVTWSNNKGGNGSANGTASWTISGVSLSSGDNTITVTVRDGAGNIGIDTIIVTYNAGTDPSDAILIFDADSYNLGSYAYITLADKDRNTNITLAESLLNDVFIQTSPVNSTKVRMVETGSNSGSFKGSIEISTNTTTEFIRIQAATGDTLQIDYIDTFNTTGSTRTVTDTVNVTSSGSSPPTVTTGIATNITDNSATLNSTVNANGLSTTAWFQYGTTSGSYSNTSSTQSVSGSDNTTVSVGISELSSGATYYYQIAAQNSAGTSYGSEASLATPSDSTVPSGSISINNGASYTNSTTITLSLSATDNAGVTGYYVSTSSTTPSVFSSGWTSINSTTSYTADVSYTVSSGDGSKTVYAWYKDTSENISSNASASIILDTTTPTIIITSPTSKATYTSTSNVVSLDGIAFDSTSGISSVTWVNGNGESGIATGTTSWSISNVSLLSGDNVITVTAIDSAENTSTDTITVTYFQPTPTLPPTVTLLPLPTPTIEPNKTGIISGYVIDRRDYPIKSVKIRLKGTTKVLKKTVSDEDGVFEFADLDADTYAIIALKKGYKTVKKTITLEAGEEKDIEIVMRKTSKRIKGLILENDVQ